MATEPTLSKPAPASAPVAAPKPVATTFMEKAPNIPVAATPANIPVAGDDVPPVSEYKGLYTNRTDGEEYALCVREKDPRGKTHKLLNSLHFWEGTKEQFIATFEKK